MKSIKNFLINNWITLCIMIIGFIILFIQMNNVVMYADDFTIGIDAKSEATNLFETFVFHYRSWGGGYTYCLVIILQRLGFNIWKVINTCMIALMVFLCTKMITYKKPEYKNIVLIVLWTFIFLLGINVSRESIYWLDGSTAYVLCTFLMLMFIYIIYSKLIMKERIRKIDYILLPLSGFFAGWSSAQTGIVSLCMVLFIICYSIFKKKDKIKIIIWIATLFCLIGCLIFYMSPGNFSRMQATKEFAALNIGEKILYRINDVYNLIVDFNTYQSFEMPFYALLLMRFNFSDRNSNCC